MLPRRQSWVTATAWWPNGSDLAGRELDELIAARPALAVAVVGEKLADFVAQRGQRPQLLLDLVEPAKEQVVGVPARAQAALAVVQQLTDLIEL